MPEFFKASGCSFVRINAKTNRTSSPCKPTPKCAGMWVAVLGRAKRRYTGSAISSSEGRRPLSRGSRRFGLWATVLKSENRYIGYSGLHAEIGGNASARVKLAFYLARPYWAAASQRKPL